MPPTFTSAPPVRTAPSPSCSTRGRRATHDGTVRNSYPLAASFDFFWKRGEQGEPRERGDGRHRNGTGVGADLAVGRDQLAGDGIGNAHAVHTGGEGRVTLIGVDRLLERRADGLVENGHRFDARVEAHVHRDEHDRAHGSRAERETEVSRRALDAARLLRVVCGDGGGDQVVRLRVHHTNADSAQQRAEHHYGSQLGAPNAKGRHNRAEGDSDVTASHHEPGIRLGELAGNTHGEHEHRHARNDAQKRRAGAAETDHELVEGRGHQALCAHVEKRQCDRHDTGANLRALDEAGGQDGDVVRALHPQLDRDEHDEQHHARDDDERRRRETEDGERGGGQRIGHAPGGDA